MKTFLKILATPFVYLGSVIIIIICAIFLIPMSLVMAVMVTGSIWVETSQKKNDKVFSEMKLDELNDELLNDETIEA